MPHWVVVSILTILLIVSLVLVISLAIHEFRALTMGEEHARDDR